MNNKGEKPNAMSSEKAEDRNGNMKADSKGTDSKSQTVGQAGAGAKLSGEQRTKITTVIRNQHIAPVTNVNFSISVGTRVPRDVEFHPLPTEIVTIYPDWRGYEFILVNGQIIVVEPQSVRDRRGLGLLKLLGGVFGRADGPAHFHAPSWPSGPRHAPLLTASFNLG